ncbi:MAG: hypothetical protein C5S44_11220 [Candidatus Methanocomedens sp.]|nr:MAG: hypothetical protein C5S44_11220 [ANME-2 cluster archaeon]
MCNILIFAVMLTVLVLAGTGYASASPPDEEWNRTYGGSGITSVESFQQTADAGYILTVKINPPRNYNAGENSQYYFFDHINVLKIGPNGSEQWNRTLDGTFSNRAISVLETSDGGYLIAGSTSDCNNRDCPDDVWLIKMNMQGQEQWNLTLGGTDNEEVDFVRQTADGGYILIGNTNSYYVGTFEIWFVKVDSNGNMQWNNTFGGIGPDKAYSVNQVPGGYIIAGYTEPHSAGNSDLWLVKTNTKGEELWNNTFRGMFGGAHSVQQTRDGGYIIAGNTPFNPGHSDFLLVKIDSNGTEQWYRTFGGGGLEFNPSVRLSPDGGYIIAGKTGSVNSESYDMWLVSTDPDGYVQWEMTFGGTGQDDVARSVLLAPDGGLVVAGDKDWFSEQGTDFWLIKLGGVPSEPEGGIAPTDGEPIQTPDIPGFGAVVAVMGLLVWVGLAGRRR